MGYKKGESRGQRVLFPERKCHPMYKDSYISKQNIFIILILSFWPLYLYFVSGETTATFDTITHYIPLRYNAVHTMLEGHLPLWNHYILSGISLIGDAISNPFDVLNFVFVIFQPVIAIIVLSSLQLFLSGLFMYIYLRKSLTLTNSSSLLGGILYTFNPVLIFGIGQRLDFVDPIGSFLWLPLLMLCLDKAIENETLYAYYYAILSGIVLSLSVFGGNINIVFFMAVFISVYLLFCKGKFSKKILILGIAGIVSILITSVQLFPILEAANNGHRKLLWRPSSYDYSGLNILSIFISIFEYPIDLLFDKREFLSSFVNSHFNTQVKNNYIGLVDLFILTIIYLKRTENYKIRILKASPVAILLILLSVNYLPVKGILIHILPIFKGIRLGYISFLFYFSIIILIAYTFDFLVYNDNHKDSRLVRYTSNLRRISFCIALSLILAFTIIIFFESKGVSINLLTKRLIRIVSYSILLSLSSHFLYMIVTNGNKQKKSFGNALFVLIVLVTILLWESHFLRVFRNNTFPKNSMESKESSFLRNLKPTERFEIFHGGKDYWSIIHFGFNSPMFYKASISGGSHQLMTSRYRIVFDMINMRYPFDESYYWKDGKYVYPSAYAFLDNKEINFNMLHLLGVKYIFSRAQLNYKFLKKVVKGEKYYIYENLNVFPRAFIVFDWEILEPQAILERLKNSSFNPLEKVLLEKSENPYGIQLGLSIPSKTRKATCNFIEYSPNKVLLKISSVANGFMVLTDAYDNGWKAYIDGNEVKILNANYLFRAIIFPKGDHIVKFEYLPASFFYGSIVSLIAVIIMTVILLIGLLKSKKQDKLRELL